MAAVRWTAAEDNFKQNLSAPDDANATSVGAGPTGVDIGASVDLGSGRILWLFGDTFWANTSGQSRAVSLATNGLIRNTIGVQTGTDLSTATFTWHARTNQKTGGVAPFFPHYFPTDRFYKPSELGSLTTHGAPQPDTQSLTRVPPVNGQRQWGKYPMCGIKLTQGGEERVVVAGMYHVYDSRMTFNTAPYRSWMMVARNISGTPDTWEWKEVPIDFDVDVGSRQFHFISNGIVEVGSTVYVFCNGPWGGSGTYTVFKLPSKVLWTGKGPFEPEWLTSTGWKSFGDPRQRLNIAPAAVVGDQTGSVHRRADGQWQLSVIPTVHTSSDPRVNYALRANPDGAFGALTELYDIPLSGTDFCYQALYAPVTWTGQGANDYCLAYSRNQTGLITFTDATTYQMEFLQVTE